MGIDYPLKWNKEEIYRDNLNDSTRNTLGYALTVLHVPDFAVNELLQGKKTTDVTPEVPGSVDE